MTHLLPVPARPPERAGADVIGLLITELLKKIWLEENLTMG